MKIYYTLDPESRCFLWLDHQIPPTLGWNSREITGDPYALKSLFMGDNEPIFVPWDVVVIMSNS